MWGKGCQYELDTGSCLYLPFSIGHKGQRAPHYEARLTP